MITDRRPRIEDFEGLLGEFVAVYPDNNEEPVSWKLDQLVKLTTPPLPQMQGLDCFILIFLIDAPFDQGLFIFEAGQERFQLMATPTMPEQGKNGMQVVIN